MPFVRSRIRTIAQTPQASAAAMLAAFASFYVAAAPVGHLVTDLAAHLLKPQIVYVPRPIETPEPAPKTAPETPPVASATPQPKPVPAPAPKRENRVPEAPKVSPTVGLDLPPLDAGLPPEIPAGPRIVETARPHPAPPAVHAPRHLRHPRHLNVDDLPDAADDEELLPPDFARREFERRFLGEFSSGGRNGFADIESGGSFGHHMGGSRDGFPFPLRPMPGGSFRPRGPLGGGLGHLGHFHIF